MKITIDTKEDSHEDLVKVINLLKGVLGQETFTNLPNNTSAGSVDSSGMMSMFADSVPVKTDKDIPDTPPDFNSFLNLTRAKKENKDDCKIEFF